MRGRFLLAIAIGFSASASPCLGAITVQQTPPLGNGSVDAYAPNVMVYFTNWNRAYLSTVIQKTFWQVGPVNFDLTYQQADLTASGFNGIRLVELVHNETGATWTDFHVAIDPTVGVWEQQTPGVIPDVYQVQFNGNLNRWEATNLPLAADITIGASQVDFVFEPAYTVPDGGSFGLYIAVQPSQQNGTLHVTEYPTVPEPTTLIIWSLLGGLGIGLGWWRRRRKAA